MEAREEKFEAGIRPGSIMEACSTLCGRRYSYFVVAKMTRNRVTLQPLACSRTPEGDKTIVRPIKPFRAADEAPIKGRWWIGWDYVEFVGEGRVVLWDGKPKKDWFDRWL